MLPSVFVSLDEQEKAFVIASIRIKLDAEKAEAEKIKRAKKK